MENDARHKPTSKRKRKLLFDAIEDISSLGQGFEEQLSQVMSVFRPPQDEYDVFSRTAIRTDLKKTKQNMDMAVEERRATESRIQNLREEIERLNAETEAIQQQTETMRKKIYEQSDAFARARKIKQQFAELQQEFDGMFCKEEPEKLPADMQYMIMENEYEKKQLAVKRYELEIVSQTSKKMRFILEQGIELQK